MKRKPLVALVLLLPLIPWLVQSGSFYYSVNSDYSDLTVSHLPNAIYLMESLRSSGEFPLWSNLILGGAPFAADPLAGVWYAPGWIAYVLPQPFGFNLTVLMHLLWGGLGMVWLLRRLGLRIEAAVFGGMAFELMPKLLAHTTAGHISLVYAVSWTPWLILAELYRQKRQQKRAAVLPGLVLGLIFLADPRWAAYAGIAWLIYSLWQAASTRLDKSGRWSTAWLPGAGLQLLVALGVCAVLWLPMLELTRQSTRANLAPADILTFSLPLSRLLGLLFPTLGGFAEWVVYPGAVLVLLAVMALSRKVVRQRAAVWLVLALLGLVISLGTLWPGAETIASLPLFNLLRVPSRAWFLTGMAVIILGAYGLDNLFEDDPAHTNKRNNLILAAVTALAVLSTIGMAIMSGEVRTGAFWGAAAYLTGFVMLILIQKKPLAQTWMTAALVALVVADLGGANLLGVNFRSKCEVNGEGANAALYLANQLGDFRVYSPSYSIPQHTAAQLGLELVDGVNPLQLKTTVEFLESATGVKTDTYSVTMPAFVTGDPGVDNKNARPDTELLGLINVKYIAAEFEIQHVQLKEVWQAGSTTVYENLDFKPRVWVQAAGAEPGEEILSVGEITYQSANLMTVQVEGPGLVVLSMVDYPGWRLAVDGRPAEKLRIADVLIGTEIGEGQHEVKLIFTSPLLTLGQIISTLTWLLVLGAVALSAGRSHKRGAA
ncbi:MAG TPA: YfhO family protein [Bellilinea sp.]|nr:YfhO family protein [Bellilinea sp.]